VLPQLVGIGQCYHGTGNQLPPSTQLTVIALEPLSAAHVILPADAAAAAVAELAFQGQSWVPDSLQESQVLQGAAQAQLAPSWIWSTRRQVLPVFGGSLREVQEQEALQQLDEHIAEQELKHQALLYCRALQTGRQPALSAAQSRAGVRRRRGAVSHVLTATLVLVLKAPVAKVSDHC
jgi:hypothetical protein